MKIALLIAVWQRLEITELVYKSLKDLPSNVKPFIVLSENEHIELAKKYKLNYWYFPNLPLGKKLNYGLTNLYKEDWNYFMQIGSDDIIDMSLFEVYKPFLESNVDIIGLDKSYIYDTKTKKTIYYNGQGTAMIGAGRMISRKVVSSFIGEVDFKLNVQMCNGDIKYIPGDVIQIPEHTAIEMQRNCKGYIKEKNQMINIWTPERNRGLDGDSLRRMKQKGFNEMILETDKTFVCDIKSETNINAFETFTLNEVVLPEYFKTKLI